MPDGGHVCLLASRCHGTLYCGVTADLRQQISEHRSDVFGGFSEKHSVKLLVWFEHHVTIEGAIRREKQIKEWRREWKCNLIERDNPHWADLAVPMGFPPLED